MLNKTFKFVIRVDIHLAHRLSLGARFAKGKLYSIFSDSVSTGRSAIHLRFEYFPCPASDSDSEEDDSDASSPQGGTGRGEFLPDDDNDALTAAFAVASIRGGSICAGGELDDHSARAEEI